jgi:uncharacterized RDD family membrane protein YckC
MSSFCPECGERTAEPSAADPPTDVPPIAEAQAQAPSIRHWGCNVCGRIFESHEAAFQHADQDHLELRIEDAKAALEDVSTRPGWKPRGIHGQPARPQAGPEYPVAPQSPWAPLAERASWGYRVGAFLVDGGLAIALGLLTAWLIDLGGGDSDTADTAGGLTIVAAWIAMTSGVSAVTKGQSLGKLIAGTRALRDNGGSVGFWRSFLRDTVCRLTYVVPLVGIIDSLWPLGAQRQSLRDQMTSSHVVKTDAYPRRAAVLTIAAVVSVAAYVGLVAVRGGFETADYTRDQWVTDCETEDASASYCGCVYDGLEERLGQGSINELATAAEDELAPRTNRALDSAVNECSP